MLGRKFSNELNVSIRSYKEILEDDTISNQVKHKLIFGNVITEIKKISNVKDIYEQDPNSQHIFKLKK